MKQVIDGKMYNTDTAKEVASHSNGGSYNDFQHYEESLYRTKKGNYFLAGEGGPMTKYRELCGQDSWGGGSAIIPMTKEEAFEWAQQHCGDDDDVMEHFKDMIEEA